MRRPLLILALVIVLATVTTIPTAAQTRQIEYGTFTVASLDQNVPAAFFNFNGTEGDIITVEAVALSGSLDPRLTLLNINSTTLAVNSNDPFQPGSSDARLTYRLPATSSYSLLVEVEDNTSGQYMLRLERRSLPAASALGLDVVTQANVSTDVPAQVYTFDSALGTTVTYRSPIDGFSYVVEVLSPDGQTLAIHSGTSLAEGSTVVPANSGVYNLVVRAGSAASGGVEVQFGNGATGTQQATAEETAAPVPTEETAAPAPTEETAAAPVTDGETAVLTPSPTTAPADTTTDADAETEEGGDDGLAAGTVGSDVPTNRCNVSPKDGGVVIRQGPDVDFPAIASIPIGEYRFADGTDGAWIRLVGGGWVSSGVVDLNGPCGALPLITGDAAPTSPEQANQPPPPTATTQAAIGQR